MIVDSSRKFPPCFPQNFETSILPKGLQDIELEVYRICTNGKLNKDSFLSTYEEVNRGVKKKTCELE